MVVAKQVLMDSKEANGNGTGRRCPIPAGAFPKKFEWNDKFYSGIQIGNGKK